MSTKALPDELLRSFAECAAERATGIFTVTHVRLRRLFCLERGRLVFAASNMIEEQFDEILIRDGLLAAAHRNQAKVEAARKGVKLLRYLHDEQVVSPAKLIDALELHIRTMLENALAEPAARTELAKGKPDLGAELLVDLSAAELVLALARKFEGDDSELRVLIGPPDARPRRPDSAETLLAGVWIEPASRTLLELADGKRSVEELCEQAAAAAGDDGDPRALLRAVYGLTLLGGLEVESAASLARRGQETRDDSVTRAEAEGRIRLAAAADHYAVLGVEEGAERDAIREAYYYLARRYHPDRFRSGELADLVPQVEGYFSKVTEAYNTLADKARRAAYDVERRKKVKPEDTVADPKALARQNFARAKMLIDKKRFHDAVTSLENAVQLDDGNASYHIELGQLLGRNPRRRDDAERHLRRALELDPASGEGYYILGELLLRLGRTDEARAQFEETLRWDPAHPEALRQLGRAQKQGGSKRRGIFGS
jgi:curved DNA-binding protein CbpA